MLSRPMEQQADCRPQAGGRAMKAMDRGLVMVLLSACRVVFMCRADRVDKCDG